MTLQVKDVRITTDGKIKDVLLMDDTVLVPMPDRDIPKQPKMYRSIPEDIVLCPTCGSTFAMRNGVLQNYCSNCGQRLGEVNEQ